MKPFVLITALVLGFCAPAFAQQTRPSTAPATQSAADVRTFELTPVAPPQPAMKYQLLFDDLDQQRPGDAAVLYLQAALLMGPGTADDAEKAFEAYEAGDLKTFDKLADSVSGRWGLFQKLDLAARRDTCDWQTTMRETGDRTLLPHLSHLNALSKVLRVTALRQIEQGHAEEALVTLRLGYEMSEKVGREPVIISDLVAIGIAGRMNDTLASLMSRPASPNLYWALNDLPARRPVLRRSFDSGRMGAATSFPPLARAKSGEALTADQWRSILDAVVAMNVVDGRGPANPDPVRDTSPAILRQAQELFARANHVSAEQAAKVDPAIVLGAFYFHQYEIAYDEMYKLRTLPYPPMMVMSTAYTARAAKWRDEQPANPFLQRLPDVHRALWQFARADRQLAALTAVEALRSYAAAHGGNLPKRLEDVTETPVPENPVTGRSFEYRLENGTATLSDSQSEEPLTYTIKIRKSS